MGHDSKPGQQIWRRPQEVLPRVLQLATKLTHECTHQDQGKINWPEIILKNEYI